MQPIPAKGGAIPVRFSDRRSRAAARRSSPLSVRPAPDIPVVAVVAHAVVAALSIAAQDRAAVLEGHFVADGGIGVARRGLIDGDRHGEAQPGRKLLFRFKLFEPAQRLVFREGRLRADEHADRRSGKRDGDLQSARDDGGVA